jgi:NAD(P)-dependent dehydrogenase (short-subunit alcohol dehydrogenase family)
MATMRFDGKVAIVTGAGGNPGLGRAYALLLASRGAKVVVNDIGAGAGLPGASDNARAASVVDEILAAGGIAIADTNNVATAAGALATLETTLDAYGRVDILVNNAGLCIIGSASEISEADMRLSIDANIMTVMNTCRVVLPQMISRGYGRIVNTTSTASFGIASMTSYSAPKAAVIGYTRSLAAELPKSLDVRCNAISPGAGTRMTRATMQPGSTQDTMMMKLDPEDVAPVAAYLAHQDCLLNGEVLCASGGWVDAVVIQRTRATEISREPESVRDSVEAILDRADLRSVPVRSDTSESAKPYTPSNVSLAGISVPAAGDSVHRT